MLKIEMIKYYNQLDTIDTKYFSRLASVKLKTGLKINKLEEEMQET